MAGYLKKNFDCYAGIACKYSLMDKMTDRSGRSLGIEPELCLFAYFLYLRKFVAQTVAKRHPEFTETAVRIEKNITEGRNSSEALAEELDLASVFCDTPEICRDTDFLVLMLAWISCLRPGREPAVSLQNRILTQLDGMDSIEGVSNIVLSAALWFADSDGFRAALYERFLLNKAELNNQNKKGFT